MAKLGMLALHKIVSEYAERMCVHGEDAKRHKTEDFSVNNGATWKFFNSLLSIQDGLDKAKQTISRYCPFKEDCVLT